MARQTPHRAQEPPETPRERAGLGGSISRRGYWKVPPTVRVHSWVGGSCVSVRGRHSVGDVVLRHPVRGRWERLRALPADVPRRVLARRRPGRQAGPDASRPDPSGR